MQRRLVLALAVFLACLAYLVWRNPYRLPVTLVLEGSTAEPARLVACFDHGHGFDDRVTAHCAIAPGRFQHELSAYQPLFPIWPDVRGLRLDLESPAAGFELEAVRWTWEGGQLELPVPAPTASTWTFANLELANRSWHPLPVVTHLGLAFLAAAGVYRVMGLRQHLGEPCWWAVGARLFVREGRWAYWLLCSAATAVFSLWLVGQWPGIHTGDSDTILYQALYFRFQRWQSLVNACYFYALAQVAGPFLAVAVVHVVATAALGSAIFFYVMRQGVRWYLVLPFYLLFLGSIPIGVQSVLFRKDTPFAILNTLVVFGCVVLAFRAREAGRPVVLSPLQLLGGSLLLTLTALLRYEAVVLLVVVPAGLLCVRAVRPAASATLLAVSGIFLYAFDHALPRAAGVPDMPPQYRLSAVLHPVASLFMAPTYYTPDPERDRAIVEKIIDLPTLRSRYSPLGVDSIFWGYGAGATEQDIRDVARLAWKRCPQNLPIVLASRCHLFLAMVGFRSYDEFSNGLRHSQGRTHDLVHGIAGLQYRPLWPRLGRWQDALLARCCSYQGLLAGAFPVWQTVLPLALLVLLLLLYRWLPVSAFLAALLLCRMPILFLTMPCAFFMYVYNIHLFSFFLVPLVLVEVRRKRRQARHAGELTWTAEDDHEPGTLHGRALQTVS